MKLTKLTKRTSKELTKSSLRVYSTGMTKITVAFVNQSFEKLGETYLAEFSVHEVALMLHKMNEMEVKLTGSCKAGLTDRESGFLMMLIESELGQARETGDDEEEITFMENLYSKILKGES